MIPFNIFYKNRIDDSRRGKFILSSLCVTASCMLHAALINTTPHINTYTPATAGNLVVSELHYNPALPTAVEDPGGLLSRKDFEFLELKNVGTATINLHNVSFTDGVNFTFTNNTSLASNAYILVVKNTSAFETRYGTGLPIAGEYIGALNNGGEKIELRDAAAVVIQRFEYKDNWYDITDGDGFSLTVRDPAATNMDMWNKKSGWRPSATAGGSPGYDDSGQIPALGSIVINEVLAHSHATAPDWIELHNTTTNDINVGGWFLSDDNRGGTNSTKYEISLGTVLPANGYHVFYEDTSFGNTNGAGCHTPFSLSEGGDKVCLFSGNSGTITGYVEEEAFGASDSGIAFGRHFKDSTKSYNFVSMSQNTPGASNAYPKVGPIVISEIMYHPENRIGDSYNNDKYEYIKLYNITSSAIDLWIHDDLLSTNVSWKFTSGIDYTFPPGTTIPVGACIIIAKNLDAYAERYGSSVGIFGPYKGDLSNSGDKIELSMPGDMEKGSRYYIRIDRVNYSDGVHPSDKDMWPVFADGGGYPLTRIDNKLYGNDVANWMMGTHFLREDLMNALNWSDGLPSAQLATISSNGFYDADHTNTWLSCSTVAIGGNAVLTMTKDWASKNATLVTINHATINCANDFLIEDSTMILNKDSATLAGNDWQVCGGGVTTINGGIHTAGNKFGSRGNGELHLLDGQITAGEYAFESLSSRNTLGGDATLISRDIGTTLNMTGYMDIASNWNGSWEVGSFTPGAWETALTSGHFTLAGGVIDSNVFACAFIVSADGKSLELAPEAVNDLSIAILSGNSLKLSWNGVAKHSYSVEYNNSMATNPGWQVYTNLVKKGSIAIKMDINNDTSFYRVVSKRN